MTRPALAHTLHARALLRWAMAAALLAAAGGWDLAWPDELLSAEYRIKAAFLCKFGNYVDWPATPPGTAPAAFVIGVLASSEVVDEFTAAARGQVVDQRPIEIRRLARADPLDGVSILFIARTHANLLAETLAAVKDRPILTVTETEPGSPVSGALNFVVVDNKVKFDVSLPAAEHNSLHISARLLGVARNVAGRPL
jgi:hypothetical protein